VLQHAKIATENPVAMRLQLIQLQKKWKMTERVMLMKPMRKLLMNSKRNTPEDCFEYEMAYEIYEEVFDS